MKSNYLCFLLRMWQVSGQESTVRASLEDPSSRDVAGFASVQDLCAYLEKVSHDLEQDSGKGDELGRLVRRQNSP